MATAYAKDVLQDQHLAVGVRAGADADHRHSHLAGDAGSECRGNAFEQYHVRPGLHQAPGVGHHTLGGFRALALDPVAAQLVDELGREAQVGADRHATLGELVDAFRHPVRALDLDHLGPRLHQARGVVQALLGGGVAHEGQVGHDQ